MITAALAIGLGTALWVVSRRRDVASEENADSGGFVAVVMVAAALALFVIITGLDFSVCYGWECRGVDQRLMREAGF